MRKLWLLLAMLFPVLAYAVPGIDLFKKPDFLAAGGRRITGEVDAAGFIQQWQGTRERGLC